MHLVKQVDPQRSRRESPSSMMYEMKEARRLFSTHLQKVQGSSSICLIRDLRFESIAQRGDDGRTAYFLFVS